LLKCANKSDTLASLCTVVCYKFVYYGEISYITNSFYKHVLIIVTTLALVVNCVFINFSYCCQCIFIAHYVHIYRHKIIHIIIHIQCMKFQKFRKIYETISHATFSRCNSWQERISIFPKIENDCPHTNLTETTTWHMNNHVTFS